MSPLTKVFVVLLVLTSILLSAGTVVYVNKVKPMADVLDRAKSETVAALAAKTEAENKLGRNEEQYKAQLAQSESDVKAAAAVIAEIQDRASQAAAALAASDTKNAEMQANNTKLAGDVSVAQAINKENNDTIGTLEKSNLTLVKQAQDDETSIADLRNTVDTQKAQLENVSTQLQTLQEKVQKLSAAVIERGITPEQVYNGGIKPTSANRITGTVKERSIIAGSPWVTISVGSVDGVAKGMEFSVVDAATGTYLGRVTVTNVDTNNAVGKLEGPADRIAQVRVGSEITNSLRGS